MAINLKGFSTDNCETALVLLGDGKINGIVHGGDKIYVIFYAKTKVEVQATVNSIKSIAEKIGASFGFGDPVKIELR